MNKILMTPGPTNVPEDIREVLGQDLIHHRSAEYSKLFAGLNDKLKQIFKTESDVLTLTCSGTGAMESAVVNLFSRGDKVLVINTGKFGERFVDICNVYGVNPINLEYKWGETYRVEDVEKILEREKDLKGVFMTHSETSTGVLNNVEEIGRLLEGKDILLVVDAISGLVANRFEFDEWNVDCAIAGSQKGFLLPPGISFVALSEAAKRSVYSSDLPKFYFSYEAALKVLPAGQNPYTPAIGLVVAADLACEKILKQGLEKIERERREVREYIEESLQRLGFGFFVEDQENRSNTLLAIYKNGLDLLDMKKFLKENYGIVVSGGQGQYKEKILRIGCLGEIDKKTVDSLSEAIYDYIHKST